MFRTSPRTAAAAGSLLLTALLAPIAAPVAVAAAPPTSVTIAGSLQSELGCPGDWDPACAATHLTYDAADDVWQATFNLPTGAYEYKAALNDAWAVNYGARRAAGRSPTFRSPSPQRRP